MKQRYAKMKRKMSDAWPYMTKQRAKREQQIAVQAARNELFAKYERQLEQEHKRVDELIAKLNRLQWRREPGDVYAMMLRVDARMMTGYNTRDDLAFLARMIARQVEAEIATARFIQKAQDY